MDDLGCVEDVVAPFLCAFDIRAIRIVAKSDIFKTYAASLSIYRFYYVKKTQQWINNVISSCIYKHPFYKNLQTNVKKFRKYKKRNLVDQIYLNRQFIVLDDYLYCPACKINEVNSAIYFAIGYKLLYSDPYVDFLCDVCAVQEGENLFNCFHEPIMIKYGEKKWTDMWL